ncbi:patatin-like phospholipase family protein [Dyella kyungheensis]|uniref:Patatin-like phospholipase family protein n=1 Tax=Dyella kyungheensis TaxID=1242174 RepID=A0ABS2JTY0_9GAMM|nr:patatin-like phospholipase family protein [Dyella kyungheensis]MBM7122044.1 patatin-like phospholipase family protein [Dyella kyungheensis]
MLGKVEETRALDFSGMSTLVLAGGGNRCWWQAGALRHLMEQGMRLPAQLVGTSAGAAVAASILAEGADTALQACLKLYASNPRIFDWSSLSKLKLKFAHQHVYPAWVEAFLNETTFDTLRHSSSRLVVALTRPARFLGMRGSVAAGTVAYLVDKYLWNSIHPRLPRLFGLRQDFMVLNDCSDIEMAQSLLIAAASAPPIMSARPVGGGPAIDGGYTDNAPIPPQSEQERSTTLVMLTRHYPKLPPLFRWHGRTYWQPSQRIPVSTWDCTSKTTVHEAYDLGAQDSIQALETGLLR